MLTFVLTGKPDIETYVEDVGILYLFGELCDNAFYDSSPGV